MPLNQSPASAVWRIDLMPFAAALLLFTLPPVAAGNRTAEQAIKGKEVPIGIVTTEIYSGLDGPVRRLVRSATDLKSIWTRIYHNRVSVPPLPVVDFERDMLILVALGSRNSGGFGIDVARVVQDEGVLNIVVRIRCPSPDAITTMALAQPMQLVKVGAGDQQPNFLDLPDSSCLP